MENLDLQRDSSQTEYDNRTLTHNLNNQQKGKPQSLQQSVQTRQDLFNDCQIPYFHPCFQLRAN